jgi:hypothetical protein
MLASYSAFSAAYEAASLSRIPVAAAMFALAVSRSIWACFKVIKVSSLSASAFLMLAPRSEMWVPLLAMLDSKSPPLVLQ